jgi:hypothetical protein
MRRRLIGRIGLGASFLGATVLVGAPARAQSLPDLEVSAVEVTFGVTIDSVIPVVNTLPHCLQLAVPCTTARDLRFSGVGVLAGIARNLGRGWAIAGEVGMHRTEWDAVTAAGTLDVRSARVTSVLAGPRIATDFFSDSRKDPTIGRFFGQILIGGETSSVLSLRPALVVGGGADIAIPPAARGAPGSRPVLLRWSLDYRFAPGAGRSFSGYRLGVGVLFGPTLKPTLKSR